MYSTVILNSVAHHFTKDDLPMYIHGAEGTGASQCSVTVVADMVKQGSKLLFFTAYYMAKDDFLAQVGDINPFIVESTKLPDNLEEHQVVMIKSGEKELFMKTVTTLADLNERIIYVKNIDIMGQEVFDLIKDKNLLVVSGDIALCAFKDELLALPFHSRIALSEIEDPMLRPMPPLVKYVGYYKGKSGEGMVSLGE